MTHAEILAQARADFATSNDLPYPPELTRSGWWSDHQLANHKFIADVPTVEAVIRQAQLNTGFDHRSVLPEEMKQVIYFKLAELEYQFPHFSLVKSQVAESPHSVPESILRVGGKQLSSIFLTHLYFYLRTRAIAPGARRILELGSGYGGLARIYWSMTQDLSYTLVDLPESLFYAQVFLSANFPDARICYVTDKFPERPDDYDFILVPAQCAHLLEGQAYDLVVNTGSMQEMTQSAVGYWMHFIEDVIHTEFFYSWNYFLNDKAQLPETKDGHNLICPVLDPWWTMQYFRINAPALTVDCSQRNWLEVCVQRIPPESRPALDLVKHTNHLIRLANNFELGTNYWFACMWMAIWVCPAPHVIEAMLAGIEHFSRGKAFGVPNYMRDTDFSEVTYYLSLLPPGARTPVVLEGESPGERTDTWESIGHALARVPNGIQVHLETVNELHWRARNLLAASTRE